MKKITLIAILLVALKIQAQPPSQPVLTDYTGKYLFGADSPVQEAMVTLKDSILYMESAAGNSILSRMNRDTFSIVDFSGTAIFHRNEEGKIIGVKVEAMGYVLEGRKEDEG